MTDDEEVTLVWPERPTCHDKDPYAQRFDPASWRAADQRGYRCCSYCGSIHPEDLHSALLRGAKLGGSDWKYGWPHKFYVEGVPNAIEGRLRRQSSTSIRHGEEPSEENWAWARLMASYTPGSEVRVVEEDYTYKDKPVRSLCVFVPEGKLTHAKWYNVHLHDLNPVAFSAMAEALAKHSNIRFELTSDGLHYCAPSHGYQKS